MGKVIDSSKLDEHHVKKFQFASLEVNDETKEPFNHALFSTPQAAQEASEIEEEEKPQTTHEADSLLQKIEYLSSENIRLESELKTLQKEVEEKINSTRTEAYEEGRAEGIKETQATLQEQSDDHNIQLIKSITALDEQIQKQEIFFNDSKDELIEAASIIAKKIIKKELEEHSQIVAKKLADAFLDDLKEASAITLKVNPKDAQYIEEQFKARKNIKIDADDAINKGGIIILSDIGNIDGNIDTRIEKAIALIKREG